MEAHLRRERIDVGAVCAEGGARGGGGGRGSGGVAEAGTGRVVRGRRRAAGGLRRWSTRCSRWWPTGWWRRARRGASRSGPARTWSCPRAGRLHLWISTTGPSTRSPTRRKRPRRTSMGGCATCRIWTCGLVCYDLTSTYFEGSPRPVGGGSRRGAFGYSRDHRGDRPQIVIGLLCTSDGIPIAHQVFARRRPATPPPCPRCWPT